MRIIFLLCLTWLYITASAQPVTLNGKISTTLDGAPFSGAGIYLIKSRSAAVSAADGKFTIRLLVAEDTLVITAVGYTTVRLPVNAPHAGAILVSLVPAPNELAHVIVSTGYQQLPKERATGSFDLIDNKTLNLQAGSSILDRLNGVTPGVLFTGKTDAPLLTIHGMSTINGNMSPLVIVDNFPYQGDISNINPSDVENVTILKDAAAASIWGTQAGNGVIVITTKHGKFGQPPIVSLNSNVTVTGKPDLFYLPQISSADYIAVEKLLFSNGYYDNALNDPSYHALSPVVEILAKEASGQLNSSEANAQINAFSAHDLRTDYERYFYQPALAQQYALNVQGGSSSMSYYVSGGYDHNSSNLNELIDRVTLLEKTSFHLAKNLTIATGLSYVSAIDHSGRPAYGQLSVGQRQVPYLQIADAKGNALAVAKDYRSAYTDTAGAGHLLDWNYYPLTDYLHNRATSATSDMVATIGVQYQVSPHLKAAVDYQYERQSGDTRQYHDPESYYTRSLVNSFSQINSATGAVDYIVPDNGILALSHSLLESYNARAQLDFSNNWGKHAVNAIVGSEIRQAHTTANSVSLYGYNDNNLTTQNVDFLNQYPNYVTGEYANIDNGVSLADITNRFVSFYGNAAYTYNTKYTFSLSARRDASNLFGVNTNNKWTPLWSAGAAWDASKETFYHVSWLPNLKMRATYGFSGNVNQSMSAVTTLVFGGPDGFTNLPYAQVNQFPNPDLRWERTGTLNMGIDFSTKDHVLSGSIDYYYKRGLDLFGPALVDYTSGLNRSSVTANVADMKGYGWDISLVSNNLRGRLKWVTTLLFNYNNTAVTSFYRTSNIAATFVNDGNMVTAIVGKPLYSIVSYKWGGLDGQGNPQGYVGKDLSTDYMSIINASTGMDGLEYNGPALPLFFGSLMNSFSWRGFELTASVSYKLDYYFRAPAISYSNLFDFGIGTSDFADRWQKPGDEAHTTVPSLIYPVPAGRDAFYASSSATVHRADNIRLQFLRLAYNLPLHSNRVFSGMQLYALGSNLGILWKACPGNVDPDYALILPPSKSLTIGLKTSF